MTEGWQSGRTRTLGKRVSQQWLHGFESRPFRHTRLASSEVSFLAVLLARIGPNLGKLGERVFRILLIALGSKYGLYMSNFSFIFQSEPMFFIIC